MNPLNLAADADWKQRFRAPKVTFSTVAKRNPARGAVVTNQSGIYQLYAWDVPTGALRQATTLPAGTRSGSISGDGRWLIYHHDESGNETGHLHRVPFEGGDKEDLTPDLPPYTVLFLDESHDGNLIGFTIGAPEGFQVFALQGEERKLLFTSEALSFGPRLSSGSELAVVATTERSGKNAYNLVAVEVASGERIAELYDEESSIEFGPFSPIAGDMRLLAISDRSGFHRPFIWNPRTGERHDLDVSTLDGEVYAWDWSPDAKHILLCQVSQAQYQLYRYEIETGAFLRLNHPSGTIRRGYYVGNEIFLNLQSANQPPCVIAIDAFSGKQIRVVLTAGNVPASRSWESVTFPSMDGAHIQGWLAVPEGEGPFPTILNTHGGPTSVQTETFDSLCQSWLDHGFAWFSVNYRGSITFGKDFERAIWGRLGEPEVEDMAAAREWLIANNIALPDQILLEGGSYGGYLTLQGLGKKPDLWAGGLAMIAVADWVTQYDDQNEILKGYDRALFGGTPEELPDLYRASSPITYVEQVSAPVLIIQGSNDTRCPPRQVRLYEEKMRALGKPIEVHWFDAGHGSLAVEQSIEHQEINLRFAYKVLGEATDAV